MYYSFSNPTIGSIIPVNDKLVLDKVFLLIFVSTFCSRCLVLKKLIEPVQKESQKLPVVFTDIATKEFLKYKLKIEFVPTLILIRNGTIVFFKEGLLSENELKWIFNLGQKLLKDSS